MRAAYSNTVRKAAKIIGGRAEGDASFLSISTDSRDCDNSTLFVPLKGERFDGHDYIDELCGKREIAGYLTERPTDGGHFPHVNCGNTLHALSALAREYRLRFRMPLIGITGTNGKTTTKELICAVLSSRYRCHKSEKNYNNEIGVPFALFGLRTEHEYAVIEMGMNHSGEIERISSMALPDIAVITNAAEGHLEFLGSVEGVARAKAEIFTYMRKGARVFINRDTPTYSILERQAVKHGLEVTSYGLNEQADIYPQDYSLTEDSVSLTYRGERYSAPLYGIHNISNLLCAVALGEHAGAVPGHMKETLSSFSSIGGRSEIVSAGFTLIRDTYNSNPLSLTAALQSASLVFPKRRRIAVLADMKELGEHSVQCHYNAGGKLVEEGFSLLYAYGKDAEQIVHGARDAGLGDESASIFDSKEKLVASLKSELKDDDVVLVKGSRSMKMEEVAEELLR